LDLSKELQKSFDVTILAPADPQAVLDEVLEGVHVVRYRYGFSRSQETLAYPGAILPRLRQHPTNWLLVPLLLRGLYREVLRQLRSGRFDCVHCHWLLPQGLAMYMAQRRIPVPYVVTSHGGDAFALDGSIAAAFLKRRIMKKAASVTVVSRAIKDRLLGDPRLRPADTPIEIIPMGVDLKRFQAVNRDERWPSRHDLSRPVVLFVGRLAEKKGLSYLLQAFAREPLRSTAASLAIIGDGPLRVALDHEVRTLGLTSRVRFLGAMEHRELQTAYASADIFCAPSIIAEGGDREGLPTVLCEAAASGLPAVASRISGIPEVVLDGDTGILVNERDVQGLSEALAALVVDPTKRVRLGESARRRIEPFGWESLGERYRSLIAAAIAANRRGPAHGSY
jgi:glycosyltransferase involved in cell wall biosynthesis